MQMREGGGVKTQGEEKKMMMMMRHDDKNAPPEKPASNGICLLTHHKNVYRICPAIRRHDLRDELFDTFSGILLVTPQKREKILTTDVSTKNLTPRGRK